MKYVCAPIGNPVIGLFGFGMLNDPSTPPTVTLGGQTIENLAIGANYNLQELFLQLPSLSPGPLDIVVTGNNGTGVLNSAVTYIPSAKIIPATIQRLALKNCIRTSAACCASRFLMAAQNES